MHVGFIRALFVLFSCIVGHQIAMVFYGVKTEYALYGVVIGGASAGLIVVLERTLEKVSLRGLTAAIFGLLLALIMANLLSAVITTIEMSAAWRTSIKLVLVLIFAYVGIVFSIRGKDEFNVVIPYVKFHRQDHMAAPILLDTSAIIDGRIADVVKCRFLEGYFVVPKFVLNELHQLSDSADDLKRSKGRRGLELLNKLKKNPQFNFRIHAEDIAGLEDVDQKLVQLAKVLDARIVTTDHNLSKVAEFHGIHVLNIHELSNSLKSILLPGESLSVQLTKDGKEREQAVAYLNDGTMVVVEDAKRHMGKEINVRVTSVLQTSAGRMVFAKMHDGQ